MVMRFATTSNSGTGKLPGGNPTSTQVPRLRVMLTAVRNSPAIEPRPRRSRGRRRRQLDPEFAKRKKESAPAVAAAAPVDLTSGEQPRVRETMKRMVNGEIPSACWVSGCRATMTKQTMPLRQRMIEDMTIRNMSPRERAPPLDAGLRHLGD